MTFKKSSYYYTRNEENFCSPCIHIRMGILLYCFLFFFIFSNFFVPNDSPKCSTFLRVSSMLLSVVCECIYRCLYFIIVFFFVILFVYRFLCLLLSIFFFLSSSVFMIRIFLLFFLPSSVLLILCCVCFLHFFLSLSYDV